MYPAVKDWGGKIYYDTGAILVREHLPRRCINAVGIQDGATCLDIRHGLPKNPREIESDDVTIVVCLFNTISKKHYTRLTDGAPNTR